MLTIERAKRVLLLAVAVAVAACRHEEKMLERTIVAHQKTAVLRAAASDAHRWRTLNEIAERLMRRLNESLSVRDRGSDIARLNRVGTVSRIQVARDTFRLLDLAQHFSDLSGDNYDFTTAPLGYLWGFQGGPVPTNVPSADALLAGRVGLGAHSLTLFDMNSVSLTHSQSKMSVESLIDAYTVDMTVVESREKGLANAMVNIGMSARAIGAPDIGKTWDWDLVSPFKTNESLGTLLLDHNIAMSQSRLYETNVTIEGKTYGHIIVPRTGRPAEGTTLVIAAGPTATKAAALAEALVVAGLQGAGSVLKNFPKYEVLIIPDRQPAEIWMTKGFAPLVRLKPELQKALHVVERAKASEAVKDDDVSEAPHGAPSLPEPEAK